MARSEMLDLRHLRLFRPVASACQAKSRPLVPTSNRPGTRSGGYDAVASRRPDLDQLCRGFAGPAPNPTDDPAHQFMRCDDAHRPPAQTGSDSATGPAELARRRREAEARSSAKWPQPTSMHVPGCNARVKNDIRSSRKPPSHAVARVEFHPSRIAVRKRPSVRYRCCGTPQQRCCSPLLTHRNAASACQVSQASSANPCGRSARRHGPRAAHMTRSNSRHGR